MRRRDLLRAVLVTGAGSALPLTSARAAPCQRAERATLGS